MDITIYSRESELETIYRFLSHTIPFEHEIEFYSDKLFLSFPVVSIKVSYEQYVRLKEWAIKTKD